eukprot:CAMPEP_0170502980 /NCGR_PEP_ID=MMETSP0208-20121228/43247_1 /TAXON_ID=197538 /ORGANISM="Strombidium inclinatum, Strain S3" /LENGTH=166 /DNA_ID=CAMNT_0010782381 /DNA_START=230 /DNA_END=730 /DNA_ORIENTATION=-
MAAKAPFGSIDDIFQLVHLADAVLDSRVLFLALRAEGHEFLDLGFIGSEQLHSRVVRLHNIEVLRVNLVQEALEGVQDLVGRLSKLVAQNRSDLPPRLFVVGEVALLGLGGKVPQSSLLNKLVLLAGDFGLHGQVREVGLDVNAVDDVLHALVEVEILVRDRARQD